MRWLSALALAAALAGCTGRPEVTIEPIPPGAAAAPPAPGTTGPSDAPAGRLPEGHPEVAGAVAGKGLPPGHPQVGGGTPAEGPAETDGDPELPVKKGGLNSAEELARGRMDTKDAEAASHFERGFRLAFTTNRERRDYATAAQELHKAIELDPKYAEAHRALAYALFNRGSMSDARAMYLKAVELKPDYGEAHYALAFMLAMTDMTAGREHFKRAMELGVPDERGLGGRFYPDVAVPRK